MATIPTRRPTCTRFSTLQSEWSLWTWDIEAGIVPTC